MPFSLLLVLGHGTGHEHLPWVWPESVFSASALLLVLIVSLPDFPGCSFLREIPSVCANCLESHFSFSQPADLHGGVVGYLSVLSHASCPKEFDSSFCCLLTFTEFLAAHLPPLLAQIKLPPCSGMDMLFHIFNLPFSSI